MAGPASDGHWCRAHCPGDGREYRGVHPAVTEGKSGDFTEKMGIKNGISMGISSEYIYIYTTRSM